jgi:hypothetical protein
VRLAVCAVRAAGNSDPTVSVLERRAVTAEPSGRDWVEIGSGLVAAFALVGIVGAGVWAVVVLVAALA